MSFLKQNFESVNYNAGSSIMRICLLILFFILQINSYAVHNPADYKPKGNTSKLTFIENKSQWNEIVLYKTEIPGGFLYLEKNGFTFDFIDQEAYKNIRGHGQENRAISDVIKAHCLKTSFINANPSVSVSSSQKVNNYYNFFYGNDQSKWAGNVSGFEKIHYDNIYPFIDLDVYSNQAYLKYDFIVEAGGDPSKIILSYEGTDGMQLKNGHLLIQTSINQITEQKPYAYQVIEGVAREVPCQYILKGNQISYLFPEGYDKTAELIIDPVLIFSTYSGSFSDNFGYTATFDSKGFLYAGSTAFGPQYPPTFGAYDLTFNGGNVDIAITKYDTSGTSMIYSTYIGGNRDELPHSLVVNSYDELFIYGTTGSANFPVTANGYDQTFNGGTSVTPANLGVSFNSGTDIFVAHLSNDGSQMLGSTYLGGNQNDGLNYTSNVQANNLLRYNYADEVRGEIDIDAQNNIYIVSCTRSLDFPIVGNSFQTAFGGGALEGVVIKMNNSLSAIVWSSFIGGTGQDAAYSLALDKNDHIYIAGGTSSLDFPVMPSALQNVYQGGRSDGFIIHISKNGQAVLNTTYYGSPTYDQIYFVETDKQNNVYVFGQTEAAGNTFIFNVAYSNPGSGQFISKISPQLNTLIFSTAFGTGSGGPNISPSAFLVDVCNKIYLSGWGGQTNQTGTNNAGFTTGMDITADAFQSTTDGSDFYLMVLQDDASALVYATFFGGPLSREHVDGGTSRFDKKGRIYQAACAGCWNNDDFPVYPNPGAVSTVNNSNRCNSAVVKLDLDQPMTVADFDAPPPGCDPYTIQFNNNSIGSDSTDYFWDFGDGNNSTDFNPSHDYTAGGIFNVMLITTDPVSCNLSDTSFAQVIILSDTSYTISPQSVCISGAVQIGVMPVYDPAITYQWSPAEGLSDTTIANPFAEPNQTTQYVLIVSNGTCTDTLNQTVHYYPDLLVTSADTFICSPADISLFATTSGNYNQYIWSSSADFSDTLNALNDSVISVFVNNTSTFYVKASESICALVDSVTVNIHPGETTTLNPESLCVNDSVQIGPAPSSDPNIVYSWSPSTGLNNPNIPNPSAGPVQSIQYTLLITDGVCTDTVFQYVAVTDYNLYTVNDTILCDEQQLQIFAGTNEAGTQFHWSSNAAYTDMLNAQVTDSSILVNAVQGQNVFYIKTLLQGCEKQDSVVILIDKVIIQADNLGICQGDTAVLSAESFFPGQQLSFSWEPFSSIISGSESSMALVSPEQSSVYTVTAIGPSGCQASATVNVDVSLLPKQPISVTVSDDIISVGSSVLLQAIPGTGYIYQWSPETGLNNSHIANPVATPVVTTTYTVTISDSSCAVNESVTVYVSEIICEEPNIFVPNAFTPNDDNQNDILFIRGNFIEELYFTLYNRWGEKVFETRDQAIGWNGVYKDMQADPGVFVYYLTAKCLGGEEYFKKGNVTLIR